MEKSIASQAFDSCCCAAKVFTQVKALGQWALPDSGCTWLRTGKERRPHGPTLGLVSALLIPTNPHHFGVPHEKQNEMQVAKFIYLNKSSLLIAVHAPKALTR